jgi:uncharacterized protein (DUF302 family)
MTPPEAEGIVTARAAHSVDETVERLKELLRQKEIPLVALVDHSGAAAEVGLALAPTKLLIFGNPKAGTPLMQATRSTAIDLPLKILVWEDDSGQTWVSFNSPDYLQKRHGFPPALTPMIGAVAALAAAVTAG